MLGERVPFEHLPLPAGYPCEELLVLKCLEKGQGDWFLEEFSFPRGPLRNFACTSKHFVVSTNAPGSALLGTGAHSPLTPQAVVLLVFMYPFWLPQSCGCGGFLATCGLKQSCWGLYVCVCRSSRLENERLRGSSSFLKVWEYRPEKGREIFLKLYQCFTWTRIADRVYWEECSEDKCGHVVKRWCCNNHHCPLVK